MKIMDSEMKEMLKLGDNVVLKNYDNLEMSPKKFDKIKGYIKDIGTERIQSVLIVVDHTSGGNSHTRLIINGGVSDGDMLDYNIVI